MASATLFLIVGTLLLLVSPLYQVGRRSKGLPPGPPTIPVLGNIHLFPKRDVHLQYQKWAKEYGPIYSLCLGTKTMIVLSSSEVVRDLLDKRSAIYSDRQEHYLAQEVLSGGNRLVMMHYGPVWRTLRRMIHNFLNIQKSVSYVPYQDLESKQMLFELLTQPEHFLSSLRRFSMSVTSSIVFGFRTVKFDDPRLIKLFEVLDTFTELIQSDAAALLEVFPLLRWLPDVLSPIKKASKKSHSKEMELFGSMWQNIKADTKAGKVKSCLGADMANAYEKEGVSDDIAAYTCGSILEAGADTTSNTLYGFIQAMLLFPEIQKKAQKCLDEVVGSNRLPGMEDYDNLPYIRRCVKESTRWLPAAILGFPHAVMEDDMYKEYRIPKGAGIITNVYTLHYDPAIFPDPTRFDPARFEDDEESLFYTATSPEKRGTFTFGAGRRSCQGLHIAERSLFLAISRILWAFDILPAKDSDGNDIIPDPSKLTQGFVCMPEPYKATIRPRSAERAALVRKFWDEAQADLDPDSKEWR